MFWRKLGGRAGGWRAVVHKTLTLLITSELLELDNSWNADSLSEGLAVNIRILKLGQGQGHYFENLSVFNDFYIAVTSELHGLDNSYVVCRGVL